VAKPIPDMILLTGVELGVRRASLDDRVRLRRPTRRERELLETSGMLARALAYHESEHLVCIMSLSQGINALVQDRPLMTLLTPLRLLKPGRVGSIGALASTLTGQWEAVEWWANPELIAPRLGDPPYNLLAADVRALKRLWHLFGRIDRAKCPSFVQATMRFNRSYSYQPGDQAHRLTELIGALEALYLSEMDELAYRLALRASYFLAAHPAARRDIFHVLKAAYGARSKVVHGERPPKTARVRGLDVALESVTDAVDDIVRASLIRYMSVVQTVGEARLKRTLLDDLILQGRHSRLSRALKGA